MEAKPKVKFKENTGKSKASSPILKLHQRGQAESQVQNLKWESTQNLRASNPTLDSVIYQGFKWSHVLFIFFFFCSIILLSIRMLSTSQIYGWIRCICAPLSSFFRGYKAPPEVVHLSPHFGENRNVCKILGSGEVDYAAQGGFETFLWMLWYFSSHWEKLLQLEWNRNQIQAASIRELQTSYGHLSSILEKRVWYSNIDFSWSIYKLQVLNKSYSILAISRSVECCYLWL